MNGSPPSILIVSQWFPPEQSPFGQMMFELAQDLTRRGWRVTILTGFPNHPYGTVFGGYRKSWLLEERLGEIQVWRTWLATSPRRTLLRRLATFATFTLTSCLTILGRSSHSVIFAVMQPLSMAAFLPLLARLKGAKLVFNLQDLHPDAQVALGMLRSSLLIRILRALESYGYRRCDRLTVICDAFRRHAALRGAPNERIDVIENWIDTDVIAPRPTLNAVRTVAGCAPDDFVVLWAGTLGHASGVGILADVASRLRNSRRICIVIAGEGPLKSHLERRIEQLGQNNVRFLPFQPRERLADLQAIADVSLVTLDPQASEVSVPSKVLGYMAAERAIVAAVPAESPTADLIRMANCGQIVSPGNADAISDAILFYLSRPALRKQAAEHGRAFVVAHRSRSTAAARYDAVLRSMLAR